MEFAGSSGQAQAQGLGFSRGAVWGARLLVNDPGWFYPAVRRPGE